jgi:transcriptional regulator with XRE-family HTH domain
MILDKETLSKTIGQRLRELRKTHEGIGQADIAAEIGVTKQAVNSYENGRRIPDLPILIAFAERYGCSMDYLFGLSDKPTREDKELSDVPYVQRFFESLQKLSDNERARLLESVTNMTDSLALDKVNPRRREFIKSITELNTACAEYVAMSGEAAEGIPKRAADNDLTLDDMAVVFADFISYSRMAEICEDIRKTGLEAMLHFSVRARKALLRKAITGDYLKSYRERGDADNADTETRS